MKKILFILSVLAMVMVVGCSNPTNTTIPVIIPPVVPTEPETPTEPEQPQEPEQPTEPQTPVVPEDKSPYEYVKPASVNLADYIYVGDYIFADTMNFAEWKYSNSETEYRLAFEKIARVKNDNPNTRIYRYAHDTHAEIQVIKATKYKIYVKTSVLENVNINDVAINLYNSPFNDTYDGSRIRILKNSNNSFTISGAGNEDISDYVTY